MTSSELEEAATAEERNGTDQLPFQLKACRRRPFKKVHGFFHITDLAIYGSDQALAWYRNLIGTYKFARKLDDQLSVVMPGAILDPEGSRQFRANGLHLNVLHNGHMDGIDKVGYYIRFWDEKPRKFVEAREKCNRYVKKGGR